MHKKQNILISCFAVIAICLCALSLAYANKETSVNKGETAIAYPVAKQSLIGDNGLVSTVKTSKTKKILVVITAYSSTVDQTDDTPFITANGSYVRDGIIANNMLPFGTKVKIPELYGNKEFVVEDRMNALKSDYHIDIWLPSREQAINFGVKKAYIEVSQS
jgi:3D (Asp-Asp-Asp) domain-containing protein